MDSVHPKERGSCQKNTWLGDCLASSHTHVSEKTNKWNVSVTKRNRGTTCDTGYTSCSAASLQTLGMGSRGSINWSTRAALTVESGQWEWWRHWWGCWWWRCCSEPCETERTGSKSTRVCEMHLCLPSDKQTCAQWRKRMLAGKQGAFDTMHTAGGTPNPSIQAHVPSVRQMQSTPCAL